MYFTILLYYLLLLFSDIWIFAPKWVCASMSKNAGNSSFPDPDFFVEFECSFLIKMQAKTNDLLAIQVSCYCITSLHFSCWNCITTRSRSQLCVRLCCASRWNNWILSSNEIVIPTVVASIKFNLKRKLRKRYFNSKVNYVEQLRDKVYVE